MYPEHWLNPDLNRLPTPAARKESLRSARIACKWAITRIMILNLVLIVVPGLLFAYFGKEAQIRMGRYTIAMLIVTWMGAITTFHVLGLWRLRGPMRIQIRKHLNANGIRTCLNCGYDLTGASQHAVCPECGRSQEKAGDDNRRKSLPPSLVKSQRILAIIPLGLLVCIILARIQWPQSHVARGILSALTVLAACAFLGIGRRPS